MSKFFYDTEFLEGKQSKAFGKFTKPTIDLISIGIVAEDGREYYAVSKDFNIKEAWNRFDLKIQSGDMRNLFPEGKKEYWIRENVLKPIFWDLYQRSDITVKEDFGNFNNFAGDTISNDLKMFTSLIKEYGKTNDIIAEEIKDFIYKDYKTMWVNETSSQIVSFENFIKTKSPIELYGYYSAYDHVVFMWLFGKMLDRPKGFPMFTIDLKQMIDEYAEIYDDRFMNGDETKEVKLGYIKNKDTYPKEINAHHALADAKWNYELFLFITKSTRALLNNPARTMGNQNNETTGAENNTGDVQNNETANQENLNAGNVENPNVEKENLGLQDGEGKDVINDGLRSENSDKQDETNNDEKSKEATTQPTGELAAEKSEATKEEVRSEVLLYPKEGDTLTKGQRAVGFTFNPSKDPRVDKAKLLAAAAIDQMFELQNDRESFNGQMRHAAIAITEFESAQMRAVKAITWTE